MEHRPNRLSKFSTRGAPIDIMVRPTPCAHTDQARINYNYKEFYFQIVDWAAQLHSTIEPKPTWLDRVKFSSQALVSIRSLLRENNKQSLN